MSSSLEKGVFQPNFVTFTSTDIVDRDPIAGKVFRGNQNNGFCYVTFADGSGGVEKRMKHWTGNKTGRFYRGELLAAQEYLAAQVGRIMNAPIRDCAFTNTDAQTIIMPYIDGETGAEKGVKDTPNNEQGTALRLFDYLTANSDRRPKNLIFADNGNIVGIDHALCNFRPRHPKPEFVSEIWNGGVTLENLQALKPRLMPLSGLFHQFGMGEQFGNLMSNLDRLILAFERVSAVVIAKEAFEAQTPPQGVQEAAKRALEWMADGKAGQNFTGVGRKRASDLAHGHPVSLETLKRMKAYFDRHGVDKKTPHWNEPSPGKVAWYAWGGDAGYSWAKTMVARAEKASEAVSKAFEAEDRVAAKLRDADAKADEAMNLRRNERWESAYFAHKEAARLYNAAANLSGDDDGHLTAARGKASSQDHLADEAKFQGDTGERHSPAEMDEPNPPTSIVKGDSVGHPFRGNQYAQGVVNDLDNGVSPEIALHELPGLVKGIHDLGPRDTGYDITNLTVDGEKPFQTTGEDHRLREHMPQILPSQRDEFLRDVQARYGITAQNEEVDPKDLKPSQNEIDGWKTGGVFKEFVETGVPEKRAPLVSRDGYIIDGHHYWSAALAMRAENPDYKLPIRRLDCDITTALHVANEWHDEVGNERVGIGQVSKAGVAGASGDRPGHDFHGNQWDKVGPNGLPIPTRGPSGVKAPTKADWEALSKLWEGYEVETKYGDKEWDTGLRVKPGPAYNKRMPSGVIDGMLKSLGIDKFSVDEDGNGVDAHRLVMDWAKKNGVKVDKWGMPDFTDAQQEKISTLTDRFDALNWSMRLSGIKDKDWPMGQAPAYPYDRPWRTLTTPLNSHESQLAREVLARTLRDSVPSTRTNMGGLAGVLKTGGFIPGQELGKTGLSIVSNHSAYFDKRIGFEGKLFGEITDKEGRRVSPIIGYMANKDELLDPSKPEDVKKVVELRTIRTNGGGDIDVKRSAKDASDILKNPRDFCVVYEKTWLPPQGGKPGEWTVQQKVTRISSAMEKERDEPGSDAAGRDKYTLRYYPLANPDGSLNTDVLFGTRSNTDDISRYGDVSVQFKGATIKNATITPGDSADNQRDPLPAALAAKTDPRLSMFDWGKRLSTGEIGIVEPEYIEAQFWKAPKVSDIAKVVFTGAPPTPEVVKLLDKNKVPYDVIGSVKDMSSYALKPSQFRKIYGKG